MLAYLKSKGILHSCSTIPGEMTISSSKAQDLIVNTTMRNKHNNNIISSEHHSLDHLLRFCQWQACELGLQGLCLYNNTYKYDNTNTLFVLGTNSCRALILSAILSLLSCSRSNMVQNTAE